MSELHRAKYRNKKPAAICAKCKKTVTEKYTCNSCLSTYHRSCAKLFIRFKPDIVCCVQTLSHLLESVPSPRTDTPLASPRRAPIDTAVVSPLAATHRATADSAAVSPLAAPLRARSDSAAVSPLAASLRARPVSAAVSASVLPRRVPTDSAAVAPFAAALRAPRESTAVFPQPLPTSTMSQDAGTSGPQPDPSAPALPPLPEDWATLDTAGQLALVMQTCMANGAVLNKMNTAIQENTRACAKNAESIRAIKNMHAYRQPTPDVVINGIPATVKTPFQEIVIRILKHLDLPHLNNDILDIRQIPPRPLQLPAARNYQTFSLIVTFKSVDVRAHVIKAKIRSGRVTVANIFPDLFPATFVGDLHVNEFLPNQSYALYRKARAKVQQTNFGRCWVKNGTIFVREHDDAATIPIVTEEDLQEIA